jgi:hypothetical protein
MDLLALGFTYQLVNAKEGPQCVVCGEVLANHSFMQEICVDI